MQPEQSCDNKSTIVGNFAILQRSTGKQKAQLLCGEEQIEAIATTRCGANPLCQYEAFYSTHQIPGGHWQYQGTAEPNSGESVQQSYGGTKSLFQRESNWWWAINRIADAKHDQRVQRASASVAFVKQFSVLALCAVEIDLLHRFVPASYNLARAVCACNPSQIGPSALVLFKHQPVHPVSSSVDCFPAERLCIVLSICLVSWQNWQVLCILLVLVISTSASYSAVGLENSINCALPPVLPFGHVFLVAFRSASNSANLLFSNIYSTPV